MGVEGEGGRGESARRFDRLRVSERGWFEISPYDGLGVRGEDWIPAFAGMTMWVEWEGGRGDGLAGVAGGAGCLSGVAGDVVQQEGQVLICSQVAEAAIEGSELIQQVEEVLVD